MIVTFSASRPPPKARQLVLALSELRSIADFADIEAMIKDGDVTAVVILGEPTYGLRVWANAVQREADRPKG